ncbi:MAG TPA: GNAT family N-acetyltransferase, partial [Acidimicrobiales bacterium]|nr:GNAT family N-acetyltransferase [Acidimicrobiales bacterium]
ESEGFDRTTLALPATQVELISAVAAVAPRTVVVLAHGGIVTLEGWHDDVDAVLDAFLLGQAAGGAVADLLFGVTAPSGHLAETIPLALEDNPSYVNFPGEQGHVRYGEGVMVGYRWYETARRRVRYPFGHGLGYTTFATEGISVEATGPEAARVSVTVANTGPRDGSHVVQVYVATDAGPVRRPTRELRAFAKVPLTAGTSRTVTFELDRRAFAYWDVGQVGWVVAPGSYRVQVGTDAATVVAEAEVILAGDDVVPALSWESTLGEWLPHPLVGAELRAELEAGGMDGADLDDAAVRMSGSMPMPTAVRMFGLPLDDGAAERLMRRSRPQAAPAVPASPVRYRRARPEDADAVALLHAGSWRRHYRGAFSDAFLDGDAVADRLAVWRERFADERGTVTIVAEHDGALVGFAHLIFDEDPRWGTLLENLHVVHGLKGHGIGTGLMARAAAAVREHGRGGLHLWVLEQNTAAQAFYRARGGVYVERQPGGSPSGVPGRLAGAPMVLRFAWSDPAILEGSTAARPCDTGP